MGPDSDYRCGGKKGFKFCYGSSSTYSEAEINKPMDSVYVPAGISSDKLEGLAGASYQLPTCQAMPSLTAPSRPENGGVPHERRSPPPDENVLYLTE